MRDIFFTYVFLPMIVLLGVYVVLEILSMLFLKPILRAMAKRVIAKAEAMDLKTEREIAEEEALEEKRRAYVIELERMKSPADACHVVLRESSCQPVEDLYCNTHFEYTDNRHTCKMSKY